MSTLQLGVQKPQTPDGVGYCMKIILEGKNFSLIPCQCQKPLLMAFSPFIVRIPGNTKWFLKIPPQFDHKSYHMTSVENDLCIFTNDLVSSSMKQLRKVLFISLGNNDGKTPNPLILL